MTSVLHGEMKAVEYFDKRSRQIVRLQYRDEYCRELGRFGVADDHGGWWDSVDGMIASDKLRRRKCERERRRKSYEHRSLPSLEPSCESQRSREIRRLSLEWEAMCRNGASAEAVLRSQFRWLVNDYLRDSWERYAAQFIDGGGI